MPTAVTTGRQADAPAVNGNGLASSKSLAEADRACPVRELLQKFNLPTGRSPEESLAAVMVNSYVLEDFRPVCLSLEWKLCDLSWNKLGVMNFVQNDVPNLVNNSGRHSEEVAAVFFAHCVEVGDTGPIEVLELGAGLGLFGRLFLDAFRDRCRREKRDFYDRLVYHVTDRAPRTVAQWAEQGLFADHGKHVATAICDAASPSTIKSSLNFLSGDRKLRAVFLNYLLDELPAAFVRLTPTGPEELCIRTHLRTTHELLPHYTGLIWEQVRQRAASEDPAQMEGILPILPILEFEAAFQPVARPIPHLDEALSFGHDLERLTLNHAAIDCLEVCMELLDESGVIVMNDYGPVSRDKVSGFGPPQRFGTTLALGINFPLLEHHFAKKLQPMAAADEGDDRRIHPRMLCKANLPATRAAFLKQFDKTAYGFKEDPAAEARKHVTEGRPDEALAEFRKAVLRDPWNWHLLGQTAEFIIHTVKDFNVGLELARAALHLNPWFSPSLWNALGDCLFCLDRFTESHEAFLQAKRIAPRDVRTNFNLAYTYLHFHDYEQALHVISEALASDTDSHYRKRLLDKQGQILAAIALREESEKAHLAKRNEALA